MKKFVWIFLFLFCVTACSEEEVSNPMTEYDSMEEIEEVTGYDLSYPNLTDDQA